MKMEHFGSEKEVEYDDYTYLVRDNGAVYRKKKPGTRKKKLDETWTFGIEDKCLGYMRIGQSFIHRIVAFAFLGNPSGKGYNVDHINRDKTDNRIENLRWVPSLLNSIRHPKFRNSIIKAYGSLEEFYENPNEPVNPDPSLDWVRSITKEDIQRTRQLLDSWTELDGFKKKGVLSNRVHGNRQATPPERPPIIEPDVQSLTPLAVQRNWRTPAEFPGCPDTLRQEPLSIYVNNLKPDEVFSRDKYKETFVTMAEIKNSILSVLVKSGEIGAVKPWFVCKVTIENEKFVHEGKGSCFELDGAKKAYYGLLGISYDVKTIDDYC